MRTHKHFGNMAVPTEEEKLESAPLRLPSVVPKKTVSSSGCSLCFFVPLLNPQFPHRYAGCYRKRTENTKNKYNSKKCFKV